MFAVSSPSSVGSINIVAPACRRRWRSLRTIRSAVLGSTSASVGRTSIAIAPIWSDETYAAVVGLRDLATSIQSSGGGAKRIWPLASDWDAGRVEGLVAGAVAGPAAIVTWGVKLSAVASSNAGSVKPRARRCGVRLSTRPSQG